MHCLLRSGLRCGYGFVAGCVSAFADVLDGRQTAARYTRLTRLLPTQSGRFVVPPSIAWVLHIRCRRPVCLHRPITQCDAGCKARDAAGSQPQPAPAPSMPSLPSPLPLSFVTPAGDVNQPLAPPSSSVAPIVIVTGPERFATPIKHIMMSEAWLTAVQPQIRLRIFATACSVPRARPRLSRPRRSGGRRWRFVRVGSGSSGSGVALSVVKTGHRRRQRKSHDCLSVDA